MSESAGDPLVIAIDFGALAETIAGMVASRLDLQPTSPWLDVHGAAAHLGWSPERVRKLVTRREIPFHQERTGGRLSFHRGELDRWLLSQ